MYPQITDYNEAIQNPRISLPDPELKVGSVDKTHLGLPIVLSGGFALTYVIRSGAHTWAVRCFHQEIPGVENRYKQISHVLSSLKSGYFVEFEFLPQGIVVNGGKYPIVKMRWVDGQTLDTFLDKNYRSQEVIQRLRSSFMEVATKLSEWGIAHGDLQTLNVLVQGSQLRLIDYDGMFVPGMQEGNGTEIGHRHYQHPDRNRATFGPKMDRFSLISIYMSLSAIAEKPEFYSKYRSGGEAILFTANDYEDPASSPLFNDVSRITNLTKHVEAFEKICNAPVEEVPSLDDFVALRNIPIAKRTTRTESSQTGPKPIRLQGYLGAYPVLDASRFDVVMGYIGQRVELIGKVHDVKVSRTRRGRPYAFVNFGDWRGNIVKITIWSNVLSQFGQQPNASWKGRWISITDLIDVPYSSGKYGYTHVGVTLSNPTHVVFIDEGQARYRLATASPGAQHTGTKSRNADIVARLKGQQVAASSRPGTPTFHSAMSRNAQIVQQLKTAAPAPSRGTTGKKKNVFETIFAWMFWIFIIVVVVKACGK